MADNFSFTQGAGTTAASDDAGGVHFPKTKLAAGVADSTVMIGHLEDDAHNSGEAGIMALAVRKDSAASTAGTDGDYTPLIVDATGRQWVRPAPVQTRIQVAVTTDTSAYTSGDNLFHSGSNGNAVEFANAARVSGGSGVIQSITVLDKTQAQRAAIDLLFFDRTVAAGNNINSPMAVSDADMAFCLGVIAIGPYNTAWPGTPLNSISTLLNVGLPFVLNGTGLFVLGCVRSTPTYAADSLVISLTILQD